MCFYTFQGRAIHVILVSELLTKLSMGRINNISGFIPTVFMIMACLLVGGFSYASYKKFSDHQFELAQHSASAAAESITRRVAALRHEMSLFAEREEALLQQAMQHPNDGIIFAELSAMLSAYFPGYFSFTLSNSVGIPQLTHSNHLLTKSCRRDLQSFATNFKAPALYVHKFTEANSLHFDLMIRTQWESQKTVPLFISFKMNELARAIDSAAVVGQILHLVEIDDKQNISKAFMVERMDNDITLKPHMLISQASESLTNAAVLRSRWAVMSFAQDGLFKAELISLSTKAAAILGLFFLITLALWHLSRREAKQFEGAGRIITGIEKDRRRIAMDMHDQVLSDLTYLSRQCNKMQESVDNANTMHLHLNASKKALENVSDSIRAIIDDIHPQTLEILGLKNSLFAYIDSNFTNASGPEIYFSATDYDEKKLSDDQRLNLYRIILELIHNIVRHAKATKCNISLLMRKKMLILHIEDDGERFRPKKDIHANARGLANIKTRTRMIGASARWCSPDAFDGGTRFELEMPLER